VYRIIRLERENHVCSSRAVNARVGNVAHIYDSPTYGGFLLLVYDKAPSSKTPTGVSVCQGRNFIAIFLPFSVSLLGIAIDKISVPKH